MNPVALALLLGDHAGGFLSNEEMEKIAKEGYERLGIKYELFAEDCDRIDRYAPFSHDDFDKAKSQLFATGYIEREGEEYSLRRNILNYVSRVARELMIYANDEIDAGNRDQEVADLLVESAFYLTEVKAKRMKKRSLLKGLEISV